MISKYNFGRLCFRVMSYICEQQEAVGREVKEATTNRERHSHICHIVSLPLVSELETPFKVFMHNQFPLFF
jgi:hypothetical protein